MYEVNTIYLCGLGAVGGLYGGLLHDRYPDRFRVIADRDRKERYEREGVFINGIRYGFRVITPGAGEPPADLLIIAVKQHQLSEAMEDVRSFVGERTVILSLLNGIVSEEILGKAFGMEKVLYSFVVGTDAGRSGTSVTWRKPGKIVFGEPRNPALSLRVASVKTLLEEAGITCEVPPDMLRELWWKFMLNVGANQVSAVLRATYGTFATVPEARELFEAASMEAVRLAEKEGIGLTLRDVRDAIEIIASLSPDGKTSMLQDIDAGRKTEVEIFSGTVISLGKKHGVPTPVNEVLFREIRALERMKGCNGTGAR